MKDLVQNRSEFHPSHNHQVSVILWGLGLISLIILLVIAGSIIRVPFPTKQMSYRPDQGIWIAPDISESYRLRPDKAFDSIRFYINDIRGDVSSLRVYISDPSSTLIFDLKAARIKKITRNVFSQSYIDFDLNSLVYRDTADIEVRFECWGSNGSGVFLPWTKVNDRHVVLHQFHIGKSLLSTLSGLWDLIEFESPLSFAPYWLVAAFTGWIVCVFASVIILVHNRRSNLKFAAIGVVCKGMLFAFFLPIWSGPDEPFHFARLRAIADGNGWSPSSVVNIDKEIEKSINFIGIRSGDDFSRKHISGHDLVVAMNDIKPLRYVQSHVKNYQSKHPVLYYAVFAPVILVSQSLNLIHQVYLIRMINVVMAIAVIWLVRKITCELTDHSVFWQNFATCLVSGYTLYIVNSATVNNDNLAVLAASIFIERIVALKSKISTQRNAFVLGIICSGALMIKLNMISLPVVYAAAVLMYGFKQKKNSASVDHYSLAKIIVTPLVLFTMTIIGMAGWWYVIPVLSGEYQTITGVADTTRLVEVSVWRFLTLTFPNSNTSFPVLVFVTLFSSVTWNFIRYDYSVYIAYLLFVVSMTAFMLYGCIRSIGLKTRIGAIPIILAGVVMLHFIVVSSMIYKYSCIAGTLRAVHGRYFYVPLAAVIGLLITGLNQLDLTRKVRLGGAVLIGFWCLLDFYVVWVYVFPWFYF